jgi:hypothetical protein
MEELALVGKNNRKRTLQDTRYLIYLSQGRGKWRVFVNIQ